jgi:hypothetical protein
MFGNDYSGCLSVRDVDDPSQQDLYSLGKYTYILILIYVYVLIYILSICIYIYIYLYMYIYICIVCKRRG